jgi:putative FmdB family regulatory protein
MPNYEFQCQKCKRAFTLKRPMSEAGDPAVCPDDDSPAQRLFSAGAVQRSGFRERHAVRLDTASAGSGASSGGGASFDKEAALEAGQIADGRADKAGVPRAPGHGD